MNYKIAMIKGNGIGPQAAEEIQAAPFPEFIEGIIQSGGLLNSLKERGLGR